MTNASNEKRNEEVRERRMSEIKLGIQKFGMTDVCMDIDDLFMRRLLVQGISGSGKSTLLKRILFGLDEKVNGLQKIILDWEGEFSTKLEGMDFVLIGGKDYPTDIEKAKVYANTLRLNNHSAIVDLSVLKKRKDRETFVERFIDEFLDCIPIEKFKDHHTHRCVFVIDEAHNLCQQNGSSESRDSIIRLCETGRKRNIATVLATQRLSEINKNASAQMANSIIGLTMDLTDRERSLKFLGLRRGAKELDEISNLDAGEFYIKGTSVRGRDSDESILMVSPKDYPHYKNEKEAHQSQVKREIKKDIETNEDIIKKLKKEIYDLKAQLNKMESLKKGEYARGWNDGYEALRKFDQDGFKTSSGWNKLREIFG